jgi:signal transduction histidine kinase
VANLRGCVATLEREHRFIEVAPKVQVWWSSMPPQRAKPKLLLVDDIEDNLVALSGALGRPEIEILTATSAAAALELCLAHDFALAILDVQMPDVDGFTLGGRMRAIERSRRVPIIFVSGATTHEVPTFDGYEVGAVDFLRKPLDARVVRHKVDVFLRLYVQRMDLEATLRMNEELLAIVTHDLRSPLASIVMVADALGRQNPNGDVRSHADRILRTSRELIDTVSELLDLSRARLAGGIPIERRGIDLGELATRVVEDMVLANPEREITLVLEGGLVGHWDHGRLRQVVTSLIANAITHGLARSKISVAVSGAGERVEVAVTNQGGLPWGTFDQMFQPFSGGEGRVGGLGLGLYIVDQIVRAHEGAVTLTTAPEATTFTVRLPRDAAAA